MTDTQKPSVEEQLARLFLAHPETKKQWETEVLQYNIWRSVWYALDPEETIEVSNHVNGPLTMSLMRFIDSEDTIYNTKLRIIDTQHGLSAPRRITEVDYLKEVLRILDQERKATK